MTPWYWHKKRTGAHRLTTDRVPSPLEIRIAGPGVSEGRIPLEDLAVVAEAVQKAVRQIASIVKTGRSHSGGRLSASLESATRLELADLSAGSVVIDVDFANRFARPFEQMDVGEIALTRLVRGLDEFNSGESTPEDWSDSVYRALAPINRVLNREHVTSIAFGRNGTTARFSRQTGELLAGRLTSRPELEFHTIRGRLMMVDFSVDRRRCRIEGPQTPPIDCTFPLDMIGTLRENATRFVEASGHAEIDKHQRPKRLSISRLRPIRSPAGAVVESPLRAIEDLVAAQEVPSIAVSQLHDPNLWRSDEELDEFLAWVDHERSQSSV